MLYLRKALLLQSLLAPALGQIQIYPLLSCALHSIAKQEKLLHTTEKEKLP